MKTQPKTKNIKKQRTSRRTRPASRAVALVHVKRVGIHHFRLVEHKHTGKLIHLHHTSHLALIVILIFIGFFLLISDNVVRATTDSGQVTINAIVPDNGQAVVTNKTNTPNITITDNILSNITWFMTPVPLYITAFALTMGFWVGDLFQYRFGIIKYHRRAH